MGARRARRIPSGAAKDTDQWLLLIHQIPPTPNYLRVKTWRRLQALGAVALKNSVYALPVSDSSREHFHWVAREIVEAGGEATVLTARLVEGLSDSAVIAMFHAARDADYAEVAKAARALRRQRLSRSHKAATEDLRAAVAKLRERLEEARAIDFFDAPGHEAARALVSELEQLVAERVPDSPARAVTTARPSGATWVTRQGIGVDRMACAWLIRRFIDPRARLRFVEMKSYRHSPGELRFDMFEAEYTHQGDQCSFEVLLECFSLKLRPLRVLAEMIHDIDLKDAKFDRAQTAGLAMLIEGIMLTHSSDDARLARASALFDELFTAAERRREPESKIPPSTT